MIDFNFEDVEFDLPDKNTLTDWIKLAVESEGKILGDITYVFCSDEYLWNMNKQYLNHDYYTDIITFDYCEGKKLSGDLFISIDSVRENAVEYGVEFDDELHRVMVHGLLHLIGYDDHTPEEEKTIHEKEDYYLKLRNIV